MDKYNNKFLLFNFTIFFLTFISIQIYVFDEKIELFSDEYSYYYSAMNINKFGLLTDDRNGKIYRGELDPRSTLSVMPGYPIYLSLVLSIFDNDIIKIRMLNIIWLSILFIYYYKFLKLFNINGRIASISLLLFTLYPGFYYNTVRLLTENIFSVIIFSGVYHIFYSNLEKIQKNEKYLNYIYGNILLVISIYIRPHALPLFFFIILLILIIKDDKEFTKNKKIVLSFLIFLGPEIIWIIRNYRISEDIILLSRAGENPKIWGAIPYYLDMSSTANYSSDQLGSMSFHSNPFVYVCWRIFGFMQYMWGDIWDEYLVHKQKYIDNFLFIHHFVLIPAIIFSPIYLFSRCIPIIFISLIPIIFTLINMPYHGLPRYVWPSIPFVFITIAYGLNFLYIFLTKKYSYNDYLKSINICKYTKFYKKHQKCKIFGFIFYFLLLKLLIFSIILFISVYLFPKKIKNHMSNYRLSKYMNTDINKMSKYWFEFETININSSQIDLKGFNSKHEKCFNGNRNDHLIFSVNVPLYKERSELKNIISKITINGQGGQYIDYMTIYWNDSDIKEYNENRVYRFPTRSTQSSQSVYVDSDIRNIIVVPAVFRPAKYCINSIEINKFAQKK